MAKDEHLRILLAATSSGDWSSWNQWRKTNPDVVPDLKAADFQYKDLRGADLRHADLKYAQLQCADLTGADLTGADLRFAELRGTNFTKARLTHATVDPASLKRAVNARIEVTEPKGAVWKRTRSGGSVNFAGVYQRLRNQIAACRCRLAKLAPGLFEHEELVTLGLSQREDVKKDRPADQTPGKSERGTE